MKKWKCTAALFVCGGIGYGLIEILWRGYTHWSMMMAGGVCFVMFSKIAETFRARSRVFKAAVCSVAVTAVEFVFGVVFNLILKMKIWDYSKMRFHLLGQICPLYTAFWGVLGLLFVPLADKIHTALQK